MEILTFYVTVMMINELTLTVPYKILGQPWLLDYVTGSNHAKLMSTFNVFFFIVFE